MTRDKVYEGTLSEIVAQYGLELGNRRLRVFVDDAEVASQPAASLTAAEWEFALRSWAAGHKTNPMPLSDEALSRDNIYEGRD